jgi:glutamyl endopeptidase
MPATSTAPSGAHAPMTNTSVESSVETSLSIQPAHAGTLGDEVAPGERTEAVARTNIREAAVAESAPDTSGLVDIGAASFPSRALIPETVHGQDDRVQIQQTPQYPWRVHASLLITARDGSSWIGTGWFIGPHTLVTAGHCVCIKHSGNEARDGWVSAIRVMPGRNGDSLPFGSVVSTQFWSVKGWVEDGDEQYDYAAIILPTDKGNEVGWFGFGVVPDNVLRDAVVNISGYPGDKPDGTQWYDSHPVASLGANKVHYDIDTMGGQSGAAVYRIENGQRIGVAVHAYGGPSTNSGTRITTPVYHNLVAWKQ